MFTNNCQAADALRSAVVKSDALPWCFTWSNVCQPGHGYNHVHSLCMLASELCLLETDGRIIKRVILSTLWTNILVNTILVNTMG